LLFVARSPQTKEEFPLALTASAVDSNNGDVLVVDIRHTGPGTVHDTAVSYLRWDYRRRQVTFVPVREDGQPVPTSERTTECPAVVVLVHPRDSYADVQRVVGVALGLPPASHANIDLFKSKYDVMYRVPWAKFNGPTARRSEAGVDFCSSACVPPKCRRWPRFGCVAYACLHPPPCVSLFVCHLQQVRRQLWIPRAG